MIASSHTSRRRHMLLLSLLLLLHAAWLLAATHYQRIYMGDSMEYIYAAWSLLEDGTLYSGAPALPIQAEYMTQRPPLYPMALAAVYGLGGTDWLVLALQNLLSIANILLLRKTLLLLGYQKKWDWLYLLLVAAYPAQFIHANMVEPEILLQSFVLLYVHYGIRLVLYKRPKDALLMGVFLSMGLFVKPVLYPFTLVQLLVMPVLAFRLRTGRPALVVASMLLPICSVLAFSAWNQQRTGKFHFTSNQSFNAIYYYYFYFSASRGVDSAKTFLKAERDTIASMPVYKDRYDYANQRGRELLRQEFFPYMRYHLKHSARFLIEPGKADIDLFTGDLTYGGLYRKQGSGFYATVRELGWWQGSIRFVRENPVMPLVLAVLLFNLLKLAGLLLFVLQRRIPLLIRLFVVLFIAYFAIITGPITAPRYVLPVSLLISGCALLGWQAWRQGRRQRRVV